MLNLVLIRPGLRDQKEKDLREVEKVVEKYYCKLYKYVFEDEEVLVTRISNLN